MKSPNLNRAMKQKIRTTLQCVRSGSYLRSSDLFRFSAADLGGLDDHRDCGQIVLDGLVAHFLGLLPHGLASAFAALHGLAEVLGTTADGHVSAGIEQLLGNGTDAAVFLELAGEAALERVVGAAVGLALRAVAATLGGVRFEHGRGDVLAGAASAPSVATEAIAAIAPLRAFRLLIFFLLSSACAVLQSPRQVSQTNFRGVLDEQNVNSRLHKVNTYLKSSFRQPSFPIPPKY